VLAIHAEQRVIFKVAYTLSMNDPILGIYGRLLESGSRVMKALLECRPCSPKEWVLGIDAWGTIEP
jgi:hypothetical protein